MKSYLLIFFLLWGVWSSAQNLRFERLDISDGLSQNNVNCMERDTWGNLWIGTLDGVNVYNGYNFEVHKPISSQKGRIVGNLVEVIGAGVNGDMWVITRGPNLNYYNSICNCFEKIDLQIFGNYNLAQVNAIFTLKDNLLVFVASNNVAVWNRMNDQFKVYPFNSTIVNAYKKEPGELILYGEMGIHLLKEVDRELVFKKIREQACYGIQASNKQVYLLQKDGIIRGDLLFDEFERAIAFGKNNDDVVAVNALSQFACVDNQFWIGGSGYLSCYTKTEQSIAFKSFQYNPDNDYSFKGFDVTRIVVDDFKNLWIGTAKNGISHLNYTTNQFEHYSWELESISDPLSNPVRAICKSKSGDLWLGFDREGVGVITTKGEFTLFKQYTDEKGQNQPIQFVRIIYEDSNGNIWIADNSRLCYFNQHNNRIETVSTIANWSWDYRCYVIKELETGSVTITSPYYLGFINLEDFSLSTLSISTGNDGNNVRDIVQDKYRNLWIAKDNSGLLKITYPSLSKELVTSETHQLSDNKVYSMLTMGDSLWVGTNSGLNLMEVKSGKVIKTFNEEDGLSNNIVYSIYGDVDGNLWLSTNKGVTKYDNTTGEFSTYLSNDFFMDDAHFKDNSGRIYYGGYTGVIAFSPETIETSHNISQPVIQKLRVDNLELHPGDTLNGNVVLDKLLPYTKTINLDYRSNSFTVEFAAYPFNVPNTNQFKYRLLGLHDNWLEVPSGRTASYNKVQPGEYQFELEVTSAASSVNRRVVLFINIIPPFWATRWFQLLLIGLGILSVFVIYRIRVLQIKQRNILLQKKVEEQTAELKQQNRKIIEMSEQLHQSDQSKLQFFTNVSHEFRTPLTIILGHIDNLKNESRHSVKAIRKNAFLLLRLINQVIDLRKLDQEKLTLEVAPLEIGPFIQTIVDSFEAIASNKNQRLYFTNRTEKLQVWVDVNKLETILYNLISNAIKYSTENKTIQVVLDQTESHFTIEVIDQGVGISPEEKDRIFERFYRVQNGNQSSGHGIGLSLVKGLVELLKGEIEVKSEPQKGSAFLLSFKLGSDHFNAEVISSTQKQHSSNNHELDDLPRYPTKLLSKKILVVEDNQELVVFLTEILETSFEVHTAENGKNALEILADWIPDVIISDVMMPLMDGIEFCKQVRTTLETSHIPIILLSAKTDVETQLEGYEIGADAYIEKPFNSKLLLARVISLIENRESLKRKFSSTQNDSNHFAELSERDQKFMKQVNDLIEENYKVASFNIELLSEKLNMSRATFYRKFSDLTGIKPADYIRKIRLNKAYRLLNEKSLSVSQVADDVGFLSASHFRKCFKAEFGRNPSEVQKG